MKATKLIAPAVLALALAACSGAQEDTDYEAGVEAAGEDTELQVREQDPDAVPVDLPETEMTTVPEGEMAEDAGGDMAAE
ncbi:hypothetical protein [Aurantiacibacter aquimixticola]|uniref:Argininosuccinate lyase n=1 Tax=Aurantiacibacter aquimixticola TaxID=1958945 RepID=A0A419RWW1_9SPHN|nr:hypothetical protein [Aurantiacibacter aquimixticola]RJY10290.1 hypothetical protein D6201_08275 [Aurantiacibacter aquimixticola]